MHVTAETDTLAPFRFTDRVRGLLAVMLLVPALAAQQDGGQPARAPRLDPGSNVVTVQAQTASLGEVVIQQQLGWRRLLAGLRIGSGEDLADEVGGSVVETAPTVTAPGAQRAPPTPAATPDAGRDVPLHGVVSVRLPTASDAGPLVVARTPRPTMEPGRSGTLRLSTAPTDLAPLATGTVRRLMTGSTQLSLPVMLTASTRTTGAARLEATPVVAAPEPQAALLPALRTDGLSSSLDDCEFLCSEAAAWSLPGSSAADDVRNDVLLDARFRPEGTGRERLPSLVNRGLARDQVREAEAPVTLDWLWGEQTLLRFESMTDEDNPFEGGGRTWIFTVFTGL